MADWKPMDIVANIGKYTDRDGNEKARWLTCGTLWMMDGEPNSLTLDAIPTPQVDQKTGLMQYKLRVFERKGRDAAPAGRSEPGTPPRRKSEPEFDDDIPFE